MNIPLKNLYTYILNQEIIFCDRLPSYNYLDNLLLGYHHKLHAHRGGDFYIESQPKSHIETLLEQNKSKL